MMPLPEELTYQLPVSAESPYTAQVVPGHTPAGVQMAALNTDSMGPDRTNTENAQQRIDYPTPRDIRTAKALLNAGSSLIHGQDVPTSYLAEPGDLTAPVTLETAVPPAESGPALANRIRHGMPPGFDAGFQPAGRLDSKNPEMIWQENVTDIDTIAIPKQNNSGYADFGQLTYRAADTRDDAPMDVQPHDTRSETAKQSLRRSSPLSSATVRDIRGIKPQPRFGNGDTAECLTSPFTPPEDDASELTYRREQISSLPAGAEKAESSAESDYIRQLPDWARRFLNREKDNTIPTAISDTAPQTAGQTISSQNPQTVRWSSPAYSEPAPTELRPAISPRQESAETQTGLTRSDLERAADQVYRMIEDRVRRERRRLGL